MERKNRKRYGPLEVTRYGWLRLAGVSVVVREWSNRGLEYYWAGGWVPLGRKARKRVKWDRDR